MKKILDFSMFKEAVGKLKVESTSIKNNEGEQFQIYIKELSTAKLLEVMDGNKEDQSPLEQFTFATNIICQSIVDEEGKLVFDTDEKILSCRDTFPINEVGKVVEAIMALSGLNEGDIKKK